MGKEEDDQVERETNSVVPWMRAPVDVSHIENCALETLPCLNPRLKEALEKMGISSLFPVQVAVWHETIGPGGFERDLCVNSPTGSGKTLSYALPIVQTLASRAVRCLRALVVLPTRDLALQVKDVFDAIAPAVGLSVGSAVGQSSIAGEIAQLIKTPKLDAGICYDPGDLSQNLESAVDILVATPGRLMDHINNTKGFTLEHLRYLVVDETDRLLREAYQSWLPTVLKLTRTSDDGLFPSSTPFVPSTFGSLQTIRRQSVERGFKGKPYPSDEAIEPEPPQVPYVRAGPSTRSGTRVLREEFNKAVEHLLNLHQPILEASDQEQADCNKGKLFNIQDGPSINLSLLTAHSANKESAKELTTFTILPTV